MGRGLVAGFVLAAALVALAQNQDQSTNQIQADVVEQWGRKFGKDLWYSLSQATRRESIQQDYDTDRSLKVEEVDGFDMVRTMAAEVQIMMQHKIDAIKRIMELAENIALDHEYDKERGSRLQNGRYHYVNAKKLNVLPENDAGGTDSHGVPEFERYLSQYRDENSKYYENGYSRLALTANPHFSGIPVNTSRSSVHVPTNVFDGEPKVINAIDWSKKLDDTFRDNYERDPSLSWQYFGSSTGFLRQYPAIKWLTYEDDPDMYDARMRDWYIKSAASSKDVVILLDTSGSMTGLRKEIAKHVVLNIMETLGEDDFLTVLTFSDETKSLVECFVGEDGEPELVQATTENIAEFTEAVNNIETEEIANFTSALTTAFNLLDKYKSKKVGTGCNQAIMLVTDGVPYTFTELFQEHNHPARLVRVFTYLIGREISDLAAAKEIACTNKGYFTHVTTLAEVKEQVLKYIPVMARPLVLLRERHPVRWTGVYADIEDPKTSRWLWNIRERDRQKRRTENYRKIIAMQRDKDLRPKEDGESGQQIVALEKLTRLNDKPQMANFLTYGKWGLKDADIEKLNKEEERKERLVREIIEAKVEKWSIPPKHLSLSFRHSEAQGQDSTFKGYKLMTTVSIPVYNKKNHTVRIAELLGVAGTDVPIAQIEKLIPPYKLGVNGYSFAVNNNGYVLYHRDLRPMFQEILKPNYNSVDLAEVELVHNPENPDEPRQNDTRLFMMRREMVEQKDGVVSSLKVVVHMDDMKRVTIREQDYFYHNISNTPFTLGIVFPKYGKYRVVGGLEVNDPQNKNAAEEAKGYLSGDKWKLHPDWVYCEYNYGGQANRMFDTPENNMKHFLERLKNEKNYFDWGNSRVRPLPKCQGNGAYTPDCNKSAGIPTAGKDSHFCDKELVQALILDAKITKVFEKASSEFTSDKLFKLFGINLSFVATRSGLTRWEQHKPPPAPNDPNFEEDTAFDPENPREPHFSEVNNEATDEVWYQRAVEYHNNNPTSFVFSVPFDIGDKRPTQVTATHAIFKGKGTRKAPAAVVGVEIDYEHFRNTFMNVSNKKGGRMSCEDNDIECYVLDNNGFVVISEDKLNTGKFFGEIDGTVLNSLVKKEVFKKIKVYDYQAICLESADDGSPASTLLSPLRMLMSAFNWILANIAYTIIRFELHHLWNPDWTYSFPQQNVLDEVYSGDYYSYDSPEPNQPPPVSDNNGGQDTANEPMYEGEEPYSEHDDSLVEEFMNKDGKAIPILEMTYIKKTQPKPCDKEVYLYELQEKVMERMGRPLQGILRGCHDSNCERPFTVSLIPHTNLILVVADTTCPCYSAKITVNPTKVNYGPLNETVYCKNLKTNLYRKKPHQCIHYHKGEDEIRLCGAGHTASFSTLLLLLTAILHQMHH